MIGFGSTALLTNSVANVYAVLEVVDTSDVTIKNIRIRRTPNIALGKGDGLSITRCNGCVVENVSIAWSIDGGLDINSSQNVIVRNSIIAEPLRLSTHVDGSHSMGMLIYTSSNVLIQGNLFVSCKERCGPRVVSSTGVTIRDNLSYNFGSHPSVVSGDYGISTVNYIDNKLIAGPDSPEITYGVAVTNVVFAVSVYADKKLVREGDWRYVVLTPFGDVGGSVAFDIEDVGAWPRDEKDTQFVACVSSRLCPIRDSVPN